MMGTMKDKVKLNVGGRIFETTATTLEIAGKKSFFGAMFDENWNLHSNLAITEHFIDRNPDCFGVLLDLLRTGELYIPPNIDKKIIYREAEYYGILDHVRSAQWGPFDGNKLRLAQSIMGCSTGKGVGTPAIRASPSSWCCMVLPFVDFDMIRVYNWMLEENSIIDLDYCSVKDVCWVDSENIAVSYWNYLTSGGIRLFSASTGELKYNFQVTDEDQLEDYTPGSLDVSSDYKLFSVCTERASNKHGIAVWDQVTGKQTDFLSHSSLGNASRLQWLYDTNCLMAASFCPKNKCCSISLIDFRVNDVVWSWYETSCWSESSGINKIEIRDAIVIEKSRAIFVIDDKARLGLMDLRGSRTKNVPWRRSDLPMYGKTFGYPKLAFHEGQLFSSMDGRIAVYGSSRWILTSQFRQSNGGPICDFSVGGDRLFALHKEENVIDVWETPRPLII